MSILAKNSPAKTNVSAGSDPITAFFNNGFGSSLFPNWNNWLAANPFPQWPSAAPRVPAIDVAEDDKEVTIKAEVPGMAEKDLDVSCEDGVLYLKGEKKGEQEEKKKDVYYKESWSGSFSRSIPLGNGVDWNKVAAKFKDGVLTVTIPKIPGSENRRKISIQ